MDVRSAGRTVGQTDGQAATFRVFIDVKVHGHVECYIFHSLCGRDTAWSCRAFHVISSLSLSLYLIPRWLRLFLGLFVACTEL